MKKPIKTEDFYRWYANLPIEKRFIVVKDNMSPRDIYVELNEAEDSKNYGQQEIERLMTIAYEIMPKE